MPKLQMTWCIELRHVSSEYNVNILNAYYFTTSLLGSQEIQVLHSN